MTTPDSEIDSGMARADRRLEDAMASRGLVDPRLLCRSLLRRLRERDASRYGDEVRFFEEVLQPRLADGADADPVEAWTDYAHRVAGAIAAGRRVSIDGSGRVASEGVPMDDDALILHLPDEPRTPASLLRSPIEPSRAQTAAIGVLVERWRTFPST